MEHIKTEHTIGYYIRTGLIILIFAAIVLGFRLGFFPIVSFAVGQIAIPLSDFFIILGAGLCGYKYGLGMFLIVFFTEIAAGRGDIINLFPLFLYLILALTSGYAAKKRLYARLSHTAVVACILEFELGNIFFLIFVYIFGGAQTGYFNTILGTIPETVLSVGTLYLYYRFAPDSLKKSFGLGYLYVSDYHPEDGDKLHLGRHITILSLSEGVIFAIVAVILSESVLGVFGENLVWPENVNRFVMRVAVFLLALTLSISVAVIINEIIIGIIVSVVRKQDSLETALQVSEAASEAKSAFLSSMSHEIRTPINAVLGMDEMILRDTKEDTTYEYAENIKTAGNILLGLVNDVLDFSKIEAGKMDIIPVEYDLASAIHDLVTMISFRADKKGLTLDTRIDAGLPSILYGDEIRLKQVITNILTNAVKYTEKGTVIFSVSFEKQNDEEIRLMVSVKDTGIGIKEEDLTRLFSAFDRIEEKRNRNIEGTGLGMSITTRLLELMGSRLSVSSVYGEGSVFSFELLQKVVSWKQIGNYEEKWRETVRENRTREIELLAPDARILAVDDMPMNLTVLTGLLKPTQMRIDTAGSGAECIEKMKETRYDLVFLDHRMPDMDGVETLKKLKEMELAPEGLSVIALTANAVSGAREEYLGYGFSDYLTKPVSLISLTEMCRKYLPEEKVTKGSASFDAIDEKQSDGQREIPVIDGMDMDYALLHIPDKELLYTAIMDFYKALDVHADKLDAIYERLPEEASFANYRILVHGMKGNAATIGIVPLAGMAKMLENAAAASDEIMIRHLHEDFIHSWRAYRDTISDALVLKENDAAKRPFDKEIITGLLEVIRIAMENFDVDRADEAMGQLIGYSYPENMQKEISLLEAFIAAVDDEGANSAIKNIKKIMEETD